MYYIQLLWYTRLFSFYSIIFSSAYDNDPSINVTIIKSTLDSRYSSISGISLRFPSQLKRSRNINEMNWLTRRQFLLLCYTIGSLVAWLTGRARIKVELHPAIDVSQSSALLWSGLCLPEPSRPSVEQHIISQHTSMCVVINKMFVTNKTQTNECKYEMISCYIPSILLLYRVTECRNISNIFFALVAVEDYNLIRLFV